MKYFRLLIVTCFICVIALPCFAAWGQKSAPAAAPVAAQASSDGYLVGLLDLEAVGQMLPEYQKGKAAWDQDVEKHRVDVDASSKKVIDKWNALIDKETKLDEQAKANKVEKTAYDKQKKDIATAKDSILQESQKIMEDDKTFQDQKMKEMNSWAEQFGTALSSVVDTVVEQVRAEMNIRVVLPKQSVIIFDKTACIDITDVVIERVKKQIGK